MKANVVIGVLGTVLDKRGKRASRWSKWRPTVALCQQEGLQIDRLELLHQPRDISMAQQVAEDIIQASPAARLVLHSVKLEDPWDFEEVYGSLLDFVSRYPFNTDAEEYLVHHYRHARGFQSLVFADRSPLSARAHFADLPGQQGLGDANRARPLFHYRSRSEPIRHADQPFRASSSTLPRFKIRHRDAQSHL